MTSAALKLSLMPQLSTKTMQAAVYDPNAKGLLSLAMIEKPEFKKNSVIVKVLGCGVCGSDLLKLDRALVAEATILGHELVGEIAEIPAELSARYDLKTGDRIVSSHHVPCGICDYCLNQQESLCKQFKNTNFNPGAFCEYTELSEGHLEHTVLKIPDAITDEVASFTEPVACCLKAIKRSGLLKRRGKIKTLVIGLGSIGLIMGQLIKIAAKEPGDISVTGLDLLDTRHALANDLSFDRVAKIASQEYDYVFLTAGAAPSIDTAMEATRDGGTIVVFSSIKGERGFDNNDIYYRELTITSSYSPNLEDLKQSLGLLSKLKLKELITHRADLNNLGSKILEAKAEQGIKVYLDLS
jgi:L-iditol 2-dehydrogenase